MNSPFITIEQACERYGISRNTLKSMFKDGAPVIQMGPKLIRIHVELFDAWIQDRFLNVGKTAVSPGSLDRLGVIPERYRLSNKSTGYKQ